MEKLKTQRGITLIALIITIIVMLILVGVSITISLNGGLFNKAKIAANNTIAERDRELGLSAGQIEIDGYSSIDEYVNANKKYKIGDEVTLGGEKFYVIAEDAEKVTLLAKDCIDTTTKKQSADAFGILISSNPVKAASDYGVQVGGTGRLMTYEEASALENKYSDILYGINGKSYWLATESGNERYWVVMLGELYAYGYLFDAYGVRPVVEISKADLS